MALIRYPGSKEKLSQQIWKLFPDCLQLRLWQSGVHTEYREPFFGAGAIGFKVLVTLGGRGSVWLNDIDEDLVCLWRSVKDEPHRLCRLITDFTPSVEAFYDFKERDGRGDCDPVERGFRKLALHRMSVSGFGAMSGGPIGGRTQQTSAYQVGCRWTPSTIKRDVFRLSRILRRFDNLRITCMDFEALLVNGGEDVFVYLDPPYYEKGGQLYKHSMTDADHARLAAALREAESHWVLSYDDHPRVRELYSWAKFTELEVTYMNAVTKGKRPKNKEVAITPA